MRNGRCEGRASERMIIPSRGAVRASWIDRFAFRAERWDGDTPVEAGLRSPQIGALHALLAHWTVTVEPATIVMPTGTGKTETMLAMLIATRPERLLVVVPTDPLREQVAEKFLGLGVLPSVGSAARLGCALSRDYAAANSTRRAVPVFPLPPLQDLFRRYDLRRVPGRNIIARGVSLTAIWKRYIYGSQSHDSI
jgi:hypothetical protein